MNKKPFVTIGMPVFNEEHFIAQSLDSLLAQDYSDFEIIISDNDSTDGTSEICLSYEAKDKRIKYICNEYNMGALENFYRVFKQSRGEFFMWAAGHDLWSENFISSCLEILRYDPSVVLATTRAIWIDHEGKIIDKKSGWNDTRGADPVSRFYTTIWGNMNAFYGLGRVEALKKIRLNIQMIGSNLISLAELSLIGSFAHACGATWYRREMRLFETEKERISRYRKSLFLPANNTTAIFPFAKIPLELLKAVLKSEIGFINKANIVLTCIPAFIAKFVAVRNKGK